MATETYFNDFGTTLNGTINSSQTTLVVNSTSAYPNPFTGLQCHIRIDDEIMLVTAINFGTLTFTVTRAQESTAGSNHANGAQILMILTAQGLNNIVNQSTTSFVGAQGSLPGSYTTIGSTYWANDAPYVNLWDGSAFSQHYVPAVSAPPAIGSWTTVSGGTFTTSQTTAGLNVTRTASGNNGGLFIAAPATPYKVAIRLRMCMASNDNNSWGSAYWLDSTSSPNAFTMIMIRGNSEMGVYNGTSFAGSSSYSSIYDPTDRILGMSGPELNIVLGDDGTTNRTLYNSCDGVNYVVASNWPRVRTDNAVYPFIGFGSGGAINSSVTLVSWRVF